MNLHVFKSGHLELLKWIALVLMTGDHINKYLYNGTISILYDFGRAALPIFICVLAYNLSGREALSKGTYGRVEIKLIIFGIIASIPYIMMHGINAKLFPLNILFTLLSITLIIHLIDKSGIINYLAASILFVVAGALVEYWWPALFFGVSLWLYFRSYKLIWIATSIVGISSLYLVNGNMWALSAIPMLVLVSKIPVNIPRMKWLFYAYYPLHLYVLWLIRIKLSNSGYIFL